MYRAARQGCAAVAVKLFGPGVGVRAALGAVGEGMLPAAVRVAVRATVGVGTQAMAVLTSGAIVGGGPKPGA